jgi:transketolase
MTDIKIIPVEEFRRIQESVADKFERLRLIADMCRANALASVKRAGSGHLGSSFSSLDIATYLYYCEMNTVKLGVGHPDRDVYFSSKGHDVPGQYAVLHSLGILSGEKLMRLRRIDGNCGHPDIGTPGIEANTGSLGMGISKAKGISIAKRLQGHGGDVYVLTGDGELQEGQIYESLISAAHQKINNIRMIIDHNKVQTDKLVSEISYLGSLEERISSFGWHVERCDGHDFESLEKALARLKATTDNPGCLIADTIKGRGVSFMEHPQDLKAGGGIYRWHSGAPDDESFAAGYEEIISRVNERLSALRLEPVVAMTVEPEKKVLSGVTREYVANAFGETLVEVAKKREDIVVLDADLAADCRLRGFEKEFPTRFIENGIAEQDMVSTAGGLALQGMLPVVNSFAAFLSSRANEQIYNNACERTRIVYVFHYSGLIPAGPGQSHQSVRDISLIAATPGFTVVQPCNAEETRMLTEYCLNQSKENCVIRLIIGPSPREITLPAGYRAELGRGAVLADGGDAVLFAYGPVMLHEALLAKEILEKESFRLKVVNMPWLNRVDPDWLKEVVGDCSKVYAVEDHAPSGGFGDRLLSAMSESSLLAGRRFDVFGVEGLPAWGVPAEVLHHHGLDGKSLSEKIIERR